MQVEGNCLIELVRFSENPTCPITRMSIFKYRTSVNCVTHLYLFFTIYTQCYVRQVEIFNALCIKVKLDEKECLSNNM